MHGESLSDAARKDMTKMFPEDVPAQFCYNYVVLHRQDSVVVNNVALPRLYWCKAVVLDGLPPS